MKESFGKALSERRLLAGINVQSAAAEYLEIIAGSGVDWAFVDCEHSAITLSDLRLVLQLFSGRVYAAVRIADQTETAIKQALDLGADGLIIPQVNSAEQLQKIISYSKYYPLGQRSVGSFRAHGYGKQFEDYLQHANQNTAIIALIENVEGVKNIESIVRVPGLSAVFVGPFDLSASLGLPGKVNEQIVQDAIEKIRLACVAVGLSLGIYCADPQKADPLHAKGYNFLSYGSDLGLFSMALGSCLEKTRASNL
jgi:2-dehydro-3-deoxyglucarate aldolase